MTTAQTAARNVARGYARTQDRILLAVRDLDEATLRWRPDGTNSIAFNVWHLARWADQLAFIIPLMDPELGRRLGPFRQIWEQGALARAWGFPAPGKLGHVETGMGMDEDLSTHLPLPPKETLFGYIERAFAAAQRAVAAVDDELYGHPAKLDLALVPWLTKPEDTGVVGGWTLAYCVHDAQHLGMINTLKGMRGLDTGA